MRLLVLLAVLATAGAGIVTVPGLGDVLGTEIESSWTKRTVHAFYGIRYALAPSGSRRFAPPVQAEPWDGLYDATSPGRKCPELLKYQVRTDPDEDLEDCLFLNVFTQTISGNSSLLPVMLYIHGGGFYEGSTTYFPPNYLMEKDIVLVVIQYRLGPLGFMSLETDDIPGNVGFMDQVFALKWVKRNIGSFAGDSEKITLFGQSAGGGSISLMLMSPMVDGGLFQRAILQSGTAFGNWVINERPKDFAEALYQELTNTTEEVDTSVIEDHLKNATVQEYHFAIQSLLLKNPSQQSNLGRAVVQKSGNVKFLDKLPSDLAKEGRIHAVPMMVGNTKHDGTYLVTLIYDSLEAYGLVNDSNYLRNNLTKDVSKLLGYKDGSDAFFDVLENKFFKKIFDEERDITFVDVVPGLTDIAGMPVFKAPSMKHAKLNSQYNQPTFLYTFDYRGQYTRFGYGEDTSKYPFDGGIHHSNDLLYLFPYSYSRPLNGNDTRIAKIMVDFWTSFAIDGKPSSPGSAAWEPLRTGRNGPYYHIDTTGHMDKDFVEIEYSAATNEIVA